jgi:hypothetical protein
MPPFFHNTIVKNTTPRRRMTLGRRSAGQREEPWTDMDARRKRA